MNRSNEQTEKKSRKKFYLLILLMALISSGLFIQRKETLIAMKNGRYHRGKLLTVSGGYYIGSISEKNYRNRKYALSDFDYDSDLTLMSVEKIRYIEFIKEPDTDQEGFSTGFIGTYRINAENNLGYLFIKEKNGTIYGSIRFPEWGNGVYESLKSLSIKGRRISFERSASSSSELKRIGVSKPFKQIYRGTLSKNGRLISGIYIIPSSRRNWYAKKIR